MSQPTYIDQPLTNVSNAWFNKTNDFIGNFIFPTVLVKKKTFLVPRYGKDALLLPSSSVRTGLSKARKVTLNRTFDPYGPLHEHSLSDDVTKDDYEQTDAPFDAESDAVENINSKMMLIDENDLATQLSDTAVITQNVNLAGTPTAQWNDRVNSDPFATLETGIAAMDSAMVRPNAMWMGWSVWLQLISNPNFLDRIKWSEIGVITQEKFLQIMAPYGITKLYVGRAKKLTNVEGQTDALGDVWGKNAWLGYVTDTPGLKQINGGYKFALENGREVTKEYFNNPPYTELVNRDYYDHLILNNSLYYLMKNVVA